MWRFVSKLFQVKEELARVRRDAVRSPKSPKASLAAQAVLRRVENERDEAISNYRNVNVEKDTFRERLKVVSLNFFYMFDYFPCLFICLYSVSPRLVSICSFFYLNLFKNYLQQHRLQNALLSSAYFCFQKLISQILIHVGFRLQPNLRLPIERNLSRRSKTWKMLCTL